MLLLKQQKYRIPKYVCERAKNQKYYQMQFQCNF